MKFWKYFKVKLRLQSWKWSFNDFFFNNLAKTKISLRTSASLVKVIEPIWSIKSDRVNLVAPVSPFHIVRDGTNWDRKVDPAQKFKWTTAARASGTINLRKQMQFYFRTVVSEISFFSICLKIFWSNSIFSRWMLINFKLCKSSNNEKIYNVKRY